jgi:Exopolysaccharide synthesis, ExoD
VIGLSESMVRPFLVEVDSVGRTIASERLAIMVGRVMPVLRFLERFTRPRWSTPFVATKRVIGGFVLLLGICLLTPRSVPTLLNAVVPVVWTDSARPSVNMRFNARAAISTSVARRRG